MEDKPSRGFATDENPVFLQLQVFKGIPSEASFVSFDLMGTILVERMRVCVHVKINSHMLSFLGSLICLSLLRCNSVSIILSKNALTFIVHVHL